MVNIRKINEELGRILEETEESIKVIYSSLNKTA